MASSLDGCGWNTTGRGVDSVVNALDTVRAAGGARAGMVVAEVEIVLASGKELVDLILERGTDIVECVDT
jgi:hypothetical protein